MIFYNKIFSNKYNVNGRNRTKQDKISSEKVAKIYIRDLLFSLQYQFRYIIKFVAFNAFVL